MRCLQRCIRNIYHDRLLFFLSLPPRQGISPCRSGNFFAVLAFLCGFCYTDKRKRGKHKRRFIYAAEVRKYDTKGAIIMLFIQYPPCSTCKKAKQWLDAHGLSYTERHIKEDNPTYEELKLWQERSGLPLKKFFNTSGLLYKSMNLRDRLPQMSEEEQLRLLASDGMLVKRPIVVTEQTVLTGFREAEWEKLLR